MVRPGRCEVRDSDLDIDADGNFTFELPRHPTQPS